MRQSRQGRGRVQVGTDLRRGSGGTRRIQGELQTWQTAVGHTDKLHRPCDRSREVLKGPEGGSEKQNEASERTRGVRRGLHHLRRRAVFRGSLAAHRHTATAPAACPGAALRMRDPDGASPGPAGRTAHAPHGRRRRVRTTTRWRHCAVGLKCACARRATPRESNPRSDRLHCACANSAVWRRRRITPRGGSTGPAEPQGQVSALPPAREPRGSAGVP